MLYEGLISPDERMLCIASSTIFHALIDNPNKLAVIEMPVKVRGTAYSLSLVEYVASLALEASIVNESLQN